MATLPPSDAVGLAGADGVGETERCKGGVELVEGDPGFDHGDGVVGVDLADRPHPIEGEHDPVGLGPAPPREPGPAPAHHQRGVRLVGQLDHRDDVVGRAGEDHGQGHHGLGGQGLVVGVVDRDRGTGDHFVIAQRPANLLDYLGHRSHLPRIKQRGYRVVAPAPSSSRRRSSATRAETSEAAVGAAARASDAMVASIGASHGLGSRR